MISDDQRGAWDQVKGCGDAPGSHRGATGEPPGRHQGATKDPSSNGFASAVAPRAHQSKKELSRYNGRADCTL